MSEQQPENIDSGKSVGDVPSMQRKYLEQVVPSLMKDFGYENKMQVPRLKKITLNMGLGQAVGNANLVKFALDELSAIAGQKAVATEAKKSIANFKLRQGVAIGCVVTLRKQRMWDFLERLISVALPRVRDFRGVNGKAFDGRGNYSLGLREQLIFPEINYDKVEQTLGMNICFVTTAETNAESKALLAHLGMPFRN